MRSISIAELEANIPELEAGNRLTLVREGKAFAEVVPLSAEPVKKWKSEEERLAYIEETMAMLRKGFDMGGFKITNRDELYDRD